MNYIEIAKEQEITLVAKKGATPTQAIQAAIEFCKEHKTCICNLEYFGFTFGIEPDSDINQLVADYNEWESLQTEPIFCEGKETSDEQPDVRSSGIAWKYFFGGGHGRSCDRYYVSEINGKRVEKHFNGRTTKYCIGNMDKAKIKYNSEAELIEAVMAEIEETI